MAQARRNCTATRAGLILALLSLGAAAQAEPIGTVADLSGTLLVSRPDGSIKVLAVNSAVEQGDTLETRKEAYARLILKDDSSVTLAPETAVTIQKYSFYKHTPRDDSAELLLIRGSVRIDTGVLGTRNGDSFTLATPTATIDVRKSSLIAEYVAAKQAQVAWNGSNLAWSESAWTASGSGRNGSARLVSFETQASRPPVFSDSAGGLRLAQNTSPGASDGRNPGLYVQVLDGTIHVTNGGGTQNFTAGQFGFTPGFQQPPVILPSNPGMQFTPPPSFSSTTGSQGSTGGKPGDVDCQVR